MKKFCFLFIILTAPSALAYTNPYCVDAAALEYDFAYKAPAGLGEAGQPE